MKPQLALLATAACILNAAAVILGRSTDAELFNRCSLASNSSGTYVSVLYAGSTGVVDYVYGQCFPYQLGADLAQQAVFCRSATCYNNPNPDCTGGAVPPVPIPVPAGLVVINFADFAQFIGQGATCWRNALSI